MGKDKSKTFEESMQRIDDIVTLLEDREISLNDSITHYEEAMNLIKECHLTLEQVEGRVKKIVDSQNKKMENLNEK